MKAVTQILAILGIQVAAVLVLARLVRSVSESYGSFSVHIWAAIAYGIPAVFGFIGWFKLRRSQSSTVEVRFIMALSVVGFGHCVALVTLQKTDVWLTKRYINTMREQLNADRRFREVRLIGYSDDYVLLPYIPVAGSVASEDDRKALDSILRKSHPPAYASATAVQVLPKELFTQPHEQ